MNQSFDNLPAMVAELNRKVDLLLSLRATPPQEADKLMTVEELIEFLPEHPARQTVYGWVNYRLIPYKKFSKRLYFRKSEIDRWLQNGRRVI